MGSCGGATQLLEEFRSGLHEYVRSCTKLLSDPQQRNNPTTQQRVVTLLRCCVVALLDCCVVGGLTATFR